MLDYGTSRRVIVADHQPRTVYYLSALAVAIGFRMNLFNIGVDGQYRLAAFVAAVVGGAVVAARAAAHRRSSSCAMVVGAIWAGIAAVLKVTRGVSEVISTIMLNSIATALIAYLLRQVDGRRRGQQQHRHQADRRVRRLPGHPADPRQHACEVFGFIIVAVLAGVAYWSARPDPVRLRPAGHRPLRDAPRWPAAST